MSESSNEDFLNNPDSNETAPTTEPTTTETETKDVTVTAEVPVEREPEPVETTTRDVDFIVPQTTDPRRNIPGTSQYLDEVERRNAELIRAKAEDREPDLAHPPAFQGTPLYTEAQAKQQGLDITGDAVSRVTLPVVEEVVSEADAASTNFDAYNGSGASVLVNSGEPRG